MKSTSFIFLIALNFNLAYGQKKSPSLVIYSVNIYTSTTISIPCDKFFSSFNKLQIDTTTYNSADTPKSISKWLKSVKYAKVHEYINTRAKIIYTGEDGLITEFCLDNFKFSVNGKTIVRDPEFYKYLRSLLPEKNRKFGR